MKGSGDSDQLVFKVLVLLDANNNVHSVHCCKVDRTKIYGQIISVRPAIREVCIVADNIAHALELAFVLGILDPGSENPCSRPIN